MISQPAFVSKFRKSAQYLVSRSMMSLRLPANSPSSLSIRLRPICNIQALFGLTVIPATFTNRVDSSITNKT